MELAVAFARESGSGPSCHCVRERFFFNSFALILDFAVSFIEARKPSTLSAAAPDRLASVMYSIGSLPKSICAFQLAALRSAQFFRRMLGDGIFLNVSWVVYSELVVENRFPGERSWSVGCHFGRVWPDATNLSKSRRRFSSRAVSSCVLSCFPFSSASSTMRWRMSLVQVISWGRVEAMASWGVGELGGGLDFNSSCFFLEKVKFEKNVVGWKGRLMRSYIMSLMLHHVCDFYWTKK